MSDQFQWESRAPKSPSVTPKSSFYRFKSRNSVQSHQTNTTLRGKEHSKLENKIIRIAAAVGIALLSLSLVIAAILASVGINSGSPTPLPDICVLSKLGYDTAIFTSPYDAANPQWILSIIVIGMFILRKHVFSRLSEYLYSHLSAIKRAKCANYFMELTGTTIVFVICSSYNLWEYSMNPDKYDHVTTEQSKDLAIGLFMMSNFFIATYILEMAFDDHMRIGLLLHHWVTIILVVWAILCCYYLNYPLKAVRVAFFISLYMSTEQNVFIEMLFYQAGYRSNVIYYISAWFYVITRVPIVGLSLWSWWEVYETVFVDGHVNNVIVFGLWIFVPLANIILNITQVTTVVSLFGIAARIARQEKGKSFRSNRSSKSNRSVVSLRMNSLYTDKPDPESMLSKDDSTRSIVVSAKRLSAHLHMSLRLHDFDESEDEEEVEDEKEDIEENNDITGT